MRRSSLNIGGKLLTTDGGLIMAILNTTPDSFYAASRTGSSELFSKVENFLTEGADILDLGAVSTRPGASFVTEEEELKRLLPVLKVLRKEFPTTPLSIDTYRSNVARIAVAEGAQIINDISGGKFDANMWKTMGELKVPYIAMHLEGTPENLHPEIQYDNVLTHLTQRFSEYDVMANEYGVSDLILDPGFGFSKTVEENYTILNNLDSFSFLNRPLLIGLSRKRMIWNQLGITPDEALNGTTVAHTLAAKQGDFIYRVHDVKEMKQVLELSKLGKGKMLDTPQHSS